MSLRETIQSHMKEAMKAREKERLSIIRMVWAAIRKEEIDSKIEALDDDSVLAIIQKEIKSKNETIECLKKDGRDEAVDEESKTLEILKAYLPAQMSEEEIRKVVLEVKEQVGASGPSDMGKMMGQLVSRLKGKCDNKVLSGLVKEVLNG